MNNLFLLPVSISLFLKNTFSVSTLTLRLQLVNDGRGGGEHDGGDTLEAELGHLAHCADVGVRALGV